MGSKCIDAKLDKAWREVVKRRACGLCEYCCGPGSNAHHIVGRRNKSTRWEIANGVYLCAKHHIFDSIFSAHQTPTLFSEWIIGQRGEEWHEGLTVMANTHKKWTKEEKEELLNEFRLCLTAKE